MKRLLSLLGTGLGVAIACMGPSTTPADGPPDTRTPEGSETITLMGDWSADQVADPLWTLSAAGDDWASLELARREGPHRLLDHLKRGGPAARAAAQAWPHVPAAWAFRGEWCAQTARYKEQDWAILLAALSNSAASRDMIGEALEPEKLVHCERLMAQATRHANTHRSGGYEATRDALAAAQAALSAPNVGGEP